MKDLGFEELETTLSNMIEMEEIQDFAPVKDITPMQSDEEEEEEKIPTMTEGEEKINIYDIEPEDASQYFRLSRHTIKYNAAKDNMTTLSSSVIVIICNLLAYLSIS